MHCDKFSASSVILALIHTLITSNGQNVYTGKNCQHALSCSDGAGTANSGPCLNGGTCANVDIDPLDDNYSYTCSCLTGFSGTDCENSNPCDPHPCNSGSCQDAGSGNHVCTCPATHTGTNCESELPCNNSPCQNGATCSNDNPYVDANSYTCSCLSGYTGTNCENELPCNSNGGNGACQNGATCTNLPYVDSNSYNCTCAEGYYGTICQNQYPCSASNNIVSGFDSTIIFMIFAKIIGLFFNHDKITRILDLGPYL